MKYNTGKILQAVGYILFVVGIALKMNDIQYGYLAMLVGAILHISGYHHLLKRYKKENEKLKATIVKLTNQRSA